MVVVVVVAVVVVVGVVVVVVVMVVVIGVRHLSPRKYRLNVAALCGTISNGRSTPCSVYNTHA